MTQVVEGNPTNLASLYVGDLKADVSEQLLWNVFSPYGQVVSVRICRDAQTQTSLRYAYVNYRNNAEAEKAIKCVNFANIDGRQCRVMWSMRDSNRRKLGIGNLFIKNIHPGVDSKNLYDAFSHFGPILSCKVALDDNGFSKGYGFIQYYSEKDAECARERSDGISFRDKKLVVANFIPRNQRPNSKAVNPDDFTNVFVKNFSADWTEEDLKGLFGRYGEITSCAISRDDSGKSNCYGFINYALPVSAREAVEALNNHPVSEEAKLYVGRAQKKLEREAFLKRVYDERKREFYRKHQDRNVYVKNFDETMTDQRLTELFNEFGKITSCHIMKDDQGKSKGFGFVCYETPDQAKVAIETMHGKVLEANAKPLFVCLAQSKEDRKKIMEQRVYGSNFARPVFPGNLYMYPQNPTPLPYAPQQFPRFPPPSRPHTRPNQPIAPGGGPQTYQMARPGMGYPQGPPQPFPGQQSYRPRMPYGNQPPMRHSQPGTHYAPRGNYPPPNHPTQVSVNTVNVDTSKVRREPMPKTAPPKKAPVEDARKVFSDKVYNLTKKVFKEQKYPESMVPYYAGVLIEFFTNTSNSTFDEAELTHALIAAYQENMGTKGPDSDGPATGEI